MELLPCPFCGGRAEIERKGDHRASTLYICMECGCSLETGETFNHGARWNQRHKPTVVHKQRPPFVIEEN